MYSHENEGTHFGQVYHRNGIVPFSVLPIRGLMMPDVNPDHLVKVRYWVEWWTQKR